jgi:hypothetical protein
MKHQVVFKLQNRVAGFHHPFAQNCKINLLKSEGLVYLNYEKTMRSVVGMFENLSVHGGEAITADITYTDNNSVEKHTHIAIEAFAKKLNEAGEVTEIHVIGLGAIPNE